MKNIKKYFKDLITDECGGPTIETAAIIAFSAMIIGIMFAVLKDPVTDMLNGSSDTLKDVNNQTIQNKPNTGK